MSSVEDFFKSGFEAILRKNTSTLWTPGVYEQLGLPGEPLIVPVYNDSVRALKVYELHQNMHWISQTVVGLSQTEMMQKHGFELDSYHSMTTTKIDDHEIALPKIVVGYRTNDTFSNEQSENAEGMAHLIFLPSKRLSMSNGKIPTREYEMDLSLHNTPNLADPFGLKKCR